jgi:hypothetical protein
MPTSKATSSSATRTPTSWTQPCRSSGCNPAPIGRSSKTDFPGARYTARESGRVTSSPALARTRAAMSMGARHRIRASGCPPGGSRTALNRGYIADEARRGPGQVARGRARRAQTDVGRLIRRQGTRSSTLDPIINAPTHDLLEFGVRGGCWLLVVANESGAHSRMSQVLIGLTQARKTGA